MFSFEINPPKFHNSLPNPTISYSNNEIEKMTMALDKKWKAICFNEGNNIWLDLTNEIVVIS